jgi:hypothetical protein
LDGAVAHPASIASAAAEQTAACAVDSPQIWQNIEQDQGRDEAIRWLTGARFRRPKGKRSAAETGTDVHAALEDFAATGLLPHARYDDEIRPFVEQFDKWAQRAQPEIVHSERTVYNDRHRYAGTADLWVTIGGQRFIADYKTSLKTETKAGKKTGPYPEVALQLAAYRYAELMNTWRPRRTEQQRRRYYLLSPSERQMAEPVPDVDGGLCIYITPEHCTAYPIDCGPDIFETFTAVIDVARFAFSTSKDVIGNPLDFETLDGKALPAIDQQLKERDAEIAAGKAKRQRRKDAAPVLPKGRSFNEALAEATQDRAGESSPRKDEGPLNNADLRPPPPVINEELSELRTIIGQLGVTEHRIWIAARETAETLKEPVPATFNDIDGLVLASVYTKAVAALDKQTNKKDSAA